MLGLALVYRAATTILLWAVAAAAQAPPPDGELRLLKTVEGIAVRTAPSGQRAPWGAAEGTIDAPPDAVLAHLTDFEHLVGVIPKLAEVKVLARRDGEAVVYFYFDLPWPIANRDYTARYRWSRDGAKIVITVDEANAEGPAPTKAVRVALLRGRWELAPRDGGGTAARYLSLVDYGGSLTRGMLEQSAWKQPLQTLQGVRKALAARPHGSASR